MKNRSRLEIIASILETTANPGATSPKIIYRSFTSYTMLQEYLLFMLERNLREIEENEKQTSSCFISTDKGRHFLYVYNKLSELIGKKQIEKKDVCCNNY